MKIYAKIEAVREAWGTSPEEWGGMPEGIPDDETVRFVYQRTWRLELYDHYNGTWHKADTAPLEGPDVHAVKYLWIES